MTAMRRPTAVALVVLFLSAGCGGDSDSGVGSDAGSASGAGPSTSATAPGDPAYVVRRVEAGNQPCGILGAAGRVWVSLYGEDALIWIDPATGEVSAPIPTGDQPCGLAFGAGSIWVEDYGSDEVTRVNATDGSVEGTFGVGQAPYDVAFAAGAAWVTDYSSGTISRVDADTGKVTATDVGGQPVGIAAAGGKVWAGLKAEGIVGLDPATGEVAVTLPTDLDATWTAATDDAVWVNVGDTVVRIDPGTGTVVGTVGVGERPADGAVVGDDVWVGDHDGQLYRFPTGAADGDATPVASGVSNPFVANELDGLLWVADFQGTDVVAIDPAQVG
jgi:hypothetical protein